MKVRPAITRFLRALHILGPEQTVVRLYLLPVEKIGTHRGPKYFQWLPSPPDFIEHPGIDCRWAMMDYGFTTNALLAADITQADHDALILNADVFAFPDDLDGPVDQEIQPFFEGINLPTDWLVPATTWRELLRQVAGMVQFNQRYGGISGGHSVFEAATLDTRLRQMTEQEQVWFLATVESFGFDSGLVDTNAKLRQLVKQAADYWAGRTFHLGFMEF